MKILLTENQVNRIILNEGVLSLYKDKNFDMEVQGGSGKYPIVLEPEEDVEMTLMLRTFIDKPILFTFAKVSPLITDIKTKNPGQDKIIRPNGFLDYTFTIPKTKTGTFTAGFTFVYQIVGSSTQITKSINIPFYREGMDERMYACKTHINEDILKEAIDWWKKWLNNQSTKNRFAKSFKYDNGTVEKHFAEYNKILSQIKMEYVFSDKRNNMWVQPGRFSNGYGLPITVNCSNSIKMGRRELYGILIHEIQHVLDDYHKFHPYNYSDSDAITPEINKDVLKNRLISVGFDESEVQRILITYLRRVKDSLRHLSHPNEIMSTLSQVRNTLKLNPEQKITKESLISNYNKSDVMIFIHQWLYSGKSFNDFLNFSNSIAMNKDDNRNLA